MTHASPASSGLALPPWWRALLLCVFLAAEASRSSGSMLPPKAQSQQRLALLVGRDAPGVAPAGIQRQIARTLRDDYGYEVVELYNQEATQKRIGFELGALFGMVKPEDTLLVYLSLKTVTVASDIYYVPEGGKEDEPWTLFPAAEMQKLFNEFSVRTALVLSPSCQKTVRLPNSLAEQTTSYKIRGARSSVAFVSFCPPTNPPEAGIPQFDAVLLTALRTEVDHDTPLTASVLSEYLRKNLLGFEVQMTKTPPYAEEEFSLTPQRSRYGPLLSKLSQADPESRVAAIDAIVKSALNERPENRGELLAAVRPRLLDLADDASQAMNVRVRSASALGEVSDHESVLGLGGLYSRAADAEVRRATIEALARIGGIEARRAVRSALDDGSPLVRAAAVRSVGYAKDESSIASVLGLLADPDDAVRIAALQAAATFPTHAEEIRAAVTPRLEDRAPEVRREALGLLATLGKTFQASRILGVLRDDTDSSVRQAAALSLVRTFDEHDRAIVEKGLLSAMEDPDFGVREAAAFALGELGGSAAESRLTRAVKDAKAPPKVRRSSAEGLGKMHSAAAVPALIDALRGPDADLRQGAAVALGAIGDPRAGDALLAALKDSNFYVRLEADRALKKLRSRSRTELTTKLRDPSPRVREEAVEQLGAFGASVVPTLIPLLADDDEKVRRTAGSTLARFRDAESVESVARALDDKSPLVREGAAGVLGDVGDEGRAGLLIAKVSDPDPAVRAEVVRALGRLRAPGAEASLIEAARDPSGSVRQAAADALRSYHSDDAVAALRRLTKDPIGAVRQTALDALGVSVTRDPKR